MGSFFGGNVLIVLCFHWVRGDHSCHAKPPNNTPLFLTWRFPVWRRFLASPAIQGTIQGWMAGRKVGESSRVHERFSGKSRGPLPDSRSGLIMGYFLLRPYAKLFCHLCLYSPVASSSFFLKYPLRHARAATPTSPVMAMPVVMFLLFDDSHEGLTSKLPRAVPSPDPV